MLGLRDAPFDDSNFANSTCVKPEPLPNRYPETAFGNHCWSPSNRMHVLNGVNYGHEPRSSFPTNSGAGVVEARNRGRPGKGARARTKGYSWHARTADLRARRYDEPAADLGYRLHIASRHVPRSCEHRRAPHPPRLFSALGGS